MAITIEDSVERIVSVLESTYSSGSSMFPRVRDALFPIVENIIFQCNTYGTSGTSGAALPLPHTLSSFLWSFPLASQTPSADPYTYPVLRPISSGYLIELFLEVGRAPVGGNVFFEFFKNGTKFLETTLNAGVKNLTIPITSDLSIREFTRDDYFAFKITESCLTRARYLTVYLRFFQYPYVMGDAQSPLPMP